MDFHQVIIKVFTRKHQLSLQADAMALLRQILADHHITNMEDATVSLEMLAKDYLLQDDCSTIVTRPILQRVYEDLVEKRSSAVPGSSQGNELWDPDHHLHFINAFDMPRWHYSQERKVFEKAAGKPANSFDQPLLPHDLPPRMTHPSASEGVMSRGFMDLNRNAPSFQPIRVDGVSQFDSLPQRLRSSPPSSRSSFSTGSNSSFYKSANEPTPSPLPLLPAFLQEVVSETSESSSSSVHESPSPPSPSSTSSAFGNTYSGDSRLSELVGAGLRRRERSSPASGAPQISNNNIHRTASHSSIWSFGCPGDRKEGIRPV